MTQTPEERKEKAKWSRILRTYGITKEIYDSLNTGQCPICFSAWSVTNPPCIDHDHHSGKIRGLLCRYCNRYRVGHFRDAAMVYRIFQYLESASALPDYIVPPKKKKKRKKRN